MIRLFSSFLLSLALALPAHAGKRLPLPDVVEDASAYATTDREKAARLLEDAVNNAEEMRVADRPAVWLHAGEQRRLLGDTDKSHKWFSEAEGRGDGSVRVAARLGLALLDAVDGLDSRVTGLLLEASDKEVLATQNADRYLLLARYAHRQNDSRKVREYSRCLLYTSPSPRDGLLSRMPSSA